MNLSQQQTSSQIRHPYRSVGLLDPEHHPVTGLILGLILATLCSYGIWRSTRGGKIRWRWIILLVILGNFFSLGAALSLLILLSP